MIYVCCISQFNVAELEACLACKPEHLVLVVSQNIAIQKAAARFELVIQQTLPASRIYRPDEQCGFGGDDAIEFQSWVGDALRPCLEQIDRLSGNHHRWMLNATGGTKIMSMALLVGLPWSRVHYQGFGSSLQNLDFLNGEFIPRKAIMSADAPAGSVVQLYADKLEFTNPPEHSDLAAAIWDALQPDSGDPLIGLFEALDTIWGDRDNPALALAKVRWHVPEDLQCNPVACWLERFSTLADGVFQPNGAGNPWQYLIPGNKINNRQQRRAHKWLCGGWLEDLVFEWLKTGGIPSGQVIKGLVSSPEQQTGSATDRDSDLFVHFRGRSTLIEVKADVAGGDYLSVERQVASFGDRLGKTRKVLFVGPDACRTIEAKGQWLRFEASLKAYNIRLCQTPESLLEAVL